MVPQQNDTNASVNKEFWNELCGTGLAKSLGIEDHSLSSIERFDNAYLDLYPYLLKYIEPKKMAGKNVLEIGLGYGTLSRCLLKKGASYLGMDVAENPPTMLKHSFNLLNIPGDTVQGDFLNNNFDDNSFDYVISIGCFHHTGNIARCIDETYRILKPGGIAILMIYNQFSLRQWIRWPFATLRALLVGNSQSNTEQRNAYDARADGSAAPVTEFTSIREAKKLLRNFQNVRLVKENCDDFKIYKKRKVARKDLLGIVGPFAGLDIYSGSEIINFLHG